MTIATRLTRLTRLPEQSDQRLRRLRPVAAGTAAGLASAGLLHAVWAAGSTWPFADARTLARTVVGESGLTGMPPPALTAAVAVALAGAAVAAIARPSTRPRLRGIARLVTVPAAGVLALRGIGGLVASAVGGEVPEYRVGDLLIYSPLCLLLATGLAALETRGSYR